MIEKWKAIENIIEGLMVLNEELLNDTKICFKEYIDSNKELQRLKNLSPLNKKSIENCGFDYKDIKSIKKLSGKIITQIWKKEG